MRTYYKNAANYISILIILVSVLSACNNLRSEAWEIAAMSENPELSKFLLHYKKGSSKEKYRAACFLISHMPGKYGTADKDGNPIYDIDIVQADSLIWSLEKSFEIRESTPYLDRYSFNDFCKYILPYRVANEPLNYYWKEDCLEWLGLNSSKEAIDSVAEEINRNIRIGILPADALSGKKSYTDIKNTGYGKCEDRAVLLVMALRASGIPAVFEFVPIWGSNDNGHAFASVIHHDDSILPLPNTDEKGLRTYLNRKTPKIYRTTYSSDKAIDVSRLHDIGLSDVHIAELDSLRESYLAVFSIDGWTPIAAGTHGHFNDVGTGVNGNGTQEDEGVNLGDGILYMPVCSESGQILPNSKPVIISEDGIRKISADTVHKATVVLERKYPLSTRVAGFAKNMIGGFFEGADRPDFSDADVLYTITDAPKCRMQKIPARSQRSYRYIRYRKHSGVFSIAELRLYDSKGESIDFIPIACQPIKNQKWNMEKVFDSDPLTYFEVGGGIDLWVGADLGKPMTVSEIGFAPRNDDNAVSPGDIYELFYWDDGWKSTGMKQAKDYSISFDDVPTDALLWLRDLTRGHEERPFTYEQGEQVWW